MINPYSIFIHFIANFHNSKKIFRIKKVESMEFFGINLVLTWINGKKSLFTRLAM